MTGDDLPLLGWQPTVPRACDLIPFPLARRVGKIRDVAQKLLTKSTDRHVESYRNQVTDALLIHMERIGVPELAQDEHLGAFWAKVDIEVARLTYRGRRPGGAA